MADFLSYQYSDREHATARDGQLLPLCNIFHDVDPIETTSKGPIKVVQSSLPLILLLGLQIHSSCHWISNFLLPGEICNPCPSMLCLSNRANPMSVRVEPLGPILNKPECIPRIPSPNSLPRIPQSQQLPSELKLQIPRRGMCVQTIHSPSSKLRGHEILEL